MIGLFDEVNKQVYQLSDKKLFFKSLKSKLLFFMVVIQKNSRSTFDLLFFAIHSYSELPSFGSGGSGGEEGFSSLLEGVVEPGS